MGLFRGPTKLKLFVGAILTMPEPRSTRIKTSNVRLNGYLVGQDSHPEPEGHSLASSRKPNVEAASTSGSRGRVAGATAPPTTLPVQQARNRAIGNDGGNSSNYIANTGRTVSDQVVSMGLVSTEHTEVIHSLRIAIAALFSVLTTGQINKIKENACRGS